MADLEIQVVDSEQGKPGDCVRVEQAFLPMVLIGGMSVVVESTTGLSTLERFVLEALVALGWIDYRVLEDLVGVPPGSGSWILGSLVQKGLADERRNGRFEPRRSHALATLRAGDVVVEQHETADIMWFPETDEAIAFGPSSLEVNALGDLTPIGSWPLSPAQAGANVADLLTRALESERVYGPLAGAIVRFDEARVLDRDVCPAYICHASSSSREHGALWAISISSAAKRSGRRLSGGVAALTFSLPLLQEQWENCLSGIETDLQVQLKRDWGLERVEMGGAGVRGEIHGEAMRRFAGERLARTAMGIRAGVGDEIVFYIPLTLVPSDDDARDLVEFDEEVGALFSSPDGNCEIPTAKLARIYDRLWRLRMFAPLYELRAKQDFDG